MNTDLLYMKDVQVFLASDSITMELFTRYEQLDLLYGWRSL